MTECRISVPGGPAPPGGVSGLGGGSDPDGGRSLHVRRLPAHAVHGHPSALLLVSRGQGTEREASGGRVTIHGGPNTG